MVWVLQNNFTSGNNISLWSYKIDAEMSACREMLDNIQINWDLTNQVNLDQASIINDFIKVQDYSGAIHYWNALQARLTNTSIAMYSVYESIILQNPFGPIPLTLGNELPDTSPGVIITPQIKSTPGATCRGPCKNYSPDAYANKPDGTYVCYSCKLMSNAFGGTIS
jgi:hypothetical protein